MEGILPGLLEPLLEPRSMGPRYGSIPGDRVWRISFILFNIDWPSNLGEYR